MATPAMKAETGRNTDFRFAHVDIEVIRDKSLSPCDKAVYAVLCANVDTKTRTISMTVQVIGDEAGCGKRTTQKSIQTLAERGVIECVKRFEDGRQLASSYRIVGYNAACYGSPQSDTLRGQDEH